MVLGNADATARIRNLARSEEFVNIFKITEEQSLKQKDVEYAVRAVVHTVEDFGTDADVQEFLDRSIARIIVDQDPNDVIHKVEWAVNTCIDYSGTTP
jgi:hypothetical protein